MAEDDLFVSAWIKWARAVGHTQALDRGIHAYTTNLHRQGLLATRREYDPQNQCVVIRVGKEPPAPSPLLSAQLGDVVHNYRGCLDHLAWALVSRGRTPPDKLTPKKQRRIYFPIYSDAGDYDRALSDKLPGVLDADAAIIRAEQPYHAGDKADNHVFAILAGLSDKDKHREIRPIFVLPESAEMRVIAEKDCTVTHWGEGRRRPLKVNAEVTRVYVRVTGPNPDVDVEIAITPLPAIYNERIRLVEWLTQIRLNTARLLNRFAERPQIVRDGTFAL